jgi:3-hydroxybutyryl-CoA dehydrogenase
MSEIRRLAVIGAGTMGGGIAQAAALNGISVNLVDVSDESLRAGAGRIEESLARMREKGRITDIQERQALERIARTLDFPSALRGVDMAIEAVPEDLELKKEVFRKLDALCEEGVVLASCTSGISITAIASSTRRRGDVIGVHFTNPVPLTRGVAIITGLETSDAVLERTKGFLRSLGKEFWITRDSPGFSGTRIMCMYINEAFNVLEEGVATAEDIDKEFKLVLGHPMGPLELADFAGLDVILKSSEYICAERGDRYRPSPLLKRLVLAGRLGKKSGRGVYEY